MKLVEVSSAAHVKAFHRLPFQIYQNDPHWNPHLQQDIDKVFDPAHNKFFKHGEACRWLLYDDNNSVIGRVAAFVNHKSSDSYPYPTGGLGFFECIDSQEAAFTLFDRCQEWLKSRGLEAMEGPVNFGEKDKYWGLVTENFEAAGYYQQNYNPEYYVKFFEAYGFQVYYNQLIYSRDIREYGLPRRFRILAERLNRQEKYRVEIIDPKKLDKYTEDFRTVYNRAWGKSHHNFTELTAAKAKQALQAMKPILDPELVYFAYDGDRPISFFIAVPNVNEIFRYVNGNLNWWGKLKFAYYRSKGVSRTFVGVVFGTDPDYQGKGIEAIIFKRLDDLVYQPRKYDRLFIAWIGDFNPKMINIVEGLEVEVYRRLATMMKVFDPNKPFSRRPIND
ncbi:MAG: hypothetical protein ACFB10_18610 [Salibacteraceae bacterium]